MELLGEGRRRRDRCEGEEAVELARGVRQEVSVGGQHLGAQLDRPEGRAADDRRDLVQPEEEGGDDAEVAAAAPDRPVEVGVLVRGGTDRLAACEHDVGLEQVVDREAALAGQMPEAATQRETTDAGGRDDPARCRQAVLVGRGIHFAPGAATADPRRPSAGIHLRLPSGPRGREPRRRRTFPARRRCGRRRARPARGRGQRRTRRPSRRRRSRCSSRSAQGAGRSSRCTPCGPRRSRGPRGL